MKRVVALLHAVAMALAASLISVSAAAQPSALAASPAGDFTFSLTHDGLARAYRVHVPARYDATQPAAVVVALHGGGGNMNLQANDSLYGLVSKSDAEGFIAVFPNGFSPLRGGQFATWNAGNCCAQARDRNVDDVGFLREVVEDVSRRWAVDRARVFATGMSNGAMMAYRLACEAPDVFHAIAAVAGTDNTRSCRPSQPVAILHMHARNDGHVQFNGGAGPQSVARSFVTDYVSVPATIAKWSQLDGCSAPPRRVLDKPGATCEVAACSGQTRVQLCVTEEGGHSWPGGRKVRAAGGEAPSQAISATDVMWDFFSRR